MIRVMEARKPEMVGKGSFQCSEEKKCIWEIARSHTLM